jgi:spore maturation protein CgeB
MTGNPINWIRTRFAARKLRGSGLFDANWYLSRNPDVKKSGIDPLLHYLQYGADEGRDPHPGFRTQWYKNQYPIVAKSGQNPLLHYFLYGKSSEYKPHPFFNSIEDWEVSESRNHKHRLELIKKLARNRNASFRVGFAVSDDDLNTTAGDFFTAMELSEALSEQFGWETTFLARSNLKADWLNAIGLDCLVVMLDDYDVSRIYNCEKHLIKVAWMRNWFDRWVERPWFKSFDLHLCSSEIAARFVQSSTGIHPSILRLATNIDRFNTRVNGSEEYSCDYCFTGNFWGYYREIESLDPECLPHNFALYGSGWENHEKFQKYLHGPIPYNKLNTVYASAKILLDDANHATKRWGSVNSRVFDGLAAGLLVITNGGAGAREVFDHKMPVYRSAEELREHLSFYLENPDHQKALVNELHSEVLERHTYAHRARQLHSHILKALAPGNRIAIKVPVPDKREAKDWGDYHFAIGLAKALEQQGFLARIDLIPNWYLERKQCDDIVIVLRGLSEYLPDERHINLMWLISHPERVTATELEHYDHVFVASKAYTRFLRSSIQAPVTELLQCTDPEIFRVHEDIEKTQSIVFVGNSREELRPVIADAIKAGLDPCVYGRGWNGLIESAFIKGEHIQNQQLGRFYAGSGIVLNDHWPDMKNHGFISNRIFDAMACGAKVVTDAVPGLNEVFGGLLYEYAGGPTDLLRAVNEAINENANMRSARIEFAKEFSTTHSFKARAEVIAQVLQQDFLVSVTTLCKS